MPAARRLRPVPDEPGRALLYTRVSALMGRGGEDFHSPDIQNDGMRRAIAQAGLREVAVVDDIDVSGQTFSRKGIAKIRQMVEAGQVDVVAVYNLSRLGRNLAEALTFIRWLRDRGVGIMSVQEHIDATTPEGQFMLGQFLNMAELYGAQIGRGWRAVISKRAQDGLTHGSPPAGYERPKGARVMTPDPVLGPVVAELFRRYATDTPMSSLVRYYAGAVGHSISYETVRRILSNPVYTGKVVLWPNQNERRWNTIPIYVGDGQHDALIDEATFRKVHRRLKADARTPPRLLAPSHSLVGLVFCGHCGRHLRMMRDKGRRPGRPSQGYDRLICPGIPAFSGVGCPGVGSPRLDLVETYVLSKVAEYVGHLRADAGARTERRGRAARSRSEVTLAERELASTRREMARLTKGWQKGLVPDSAYETNITELQVVEREIANRISVAQDAAEQMPVGEWTAAAEKLIALWPDLTTEQRNRAMKQIRIRVTIHPGERPRVPPQDRTTVEFL